MSDNKIHTLGRIDQAIRGINNDGTDDGYIPPQSENGALERIEKSIKEIDIKGIKNSYKVLQTGEGHAEDYPMLISPNYQFKPSIRDKVFFEASITYNPVAQGMKIASHNDGPGEHVKMRAPFASIHEDNPQPAFIELGTSSVKSTLKKDDLVLTGEGNTWDGEHGSLKEALALISKEKWFSGTLAASATSLTISDTAITTDSIIDIYTETYGVDPSAVVVTNGSIELTFGAQQSAMGVKIKVTNL